MVNAAQVQRARTRDLVAGIEAQVDAYQQRRPERISRTRRIRHATRDLRRALRTRDAAQRIRHDAEVEAGSALRRLRTEGQGLRDAAELCGLSHSAVKRLARLADPSTPPRTGSPSTGAEGTRAPAVVPEERDATHVPSGAEPSGNDERNL